MEFDCAGNPRRCATDPHNCAVNFHRCATNSHYCARNPHRCATDPTKVRPKWSLTAPTKMPKTQHAVLQYFVDHSEMLAQSNSI